MTYERIKDMTDRLFEVRELCESAAQDDPPWSSIYDALDMLEETLEELQRVREQGEDESE